MSNLQSIIDDSVDRIDEAIEDVILRHENEIACEYYIKNGKPPKIFLSDKTKKYLEDLPELSVAD